MIQPFPILEDGSISISPELGKAYRAKLMRFRESLHEAATKEDSVGNQMLRDLHQQLIMAQIPNDPHLRGKLTPNYPPSCERVIQSDDFYTALNRENVVVETDELKKWYRPGSL